MPVKKPVEQQIINKIERYCAYQERCKQEVRLKLWQLGLDDEAEQNKIISRLEKNKFIDEARFARAFTLDKFRLTGWGKVKIELSLKEKGIQESLIAKALSEIEQREYEKTLKQLFKKKSAELKKEKDSFQRNGKLANYLIGKGFEADLVWEMI